MKHTAKKTKKLDSTTLNYRAECLQWKLRCHGLPENEITRRVTEMIRSIDDR